MHNLPTFLRAAALPENLRIEGASENLEIQAEGTPDAKGPKKFTMTAYTGAAMRLPGFPFPVVADLQGMSIPTQSIPILRGHDMDQIVGHTTEITLSPQRLKLAGLMSGIGQPAQEVRDLAGNGFPWQASIGASVQRMELIERGETTTVNGRSFTGPLYVARQTTLGEVSFVAIGADVGTSATIAAGAGTTGASTMNFEQWLKATGLDPAQLSGDQRQHLQAAYDAQKPKPPETPPPSPGVPPPTPPPTTPDPTAEYRRAMAAETQRVAAVREICARSARPPMMTMVAEGKETQVSIEAHAIEHRWDANRTELEVLRCARPTPPMPTGGAGSRPASANVIEASLCLSCGLPDKRVADWYGQETVAAAMGRDFRRMGIQDLCHTTIAAAGKHARPGRLNDDGIRTALEADMQLRAGGGDFSTLSMAGLLSNLANKILLNSYSAVDAVIPTIAGERNTNDFKPFYSFRMTADGVFQVLGPDGELKTMNLFEEPYQNRLQTYGRIVTLTRADIINDDLDAFAQIPRALGRGAVLAIEKIGFTVLMTGIGTLFSVANHNYIAGNGTGNAVDSTLSIPGLGNAVAAFRSQTDVAGNPVMIEPKILLVPPGLEQAGKGLLMSNAIVYLANKVTPAANTFAGMFAPKVSPYLSNPNMPNNSPTGWFLLASADDVPVLQIAYLRGQRTPIIEPGTTDFDALGMKWRGYFDFGIAPQDSRGGVYMVGA